MSNNFTPKRSVEIPLATQARLLLEAQPGSTVAFNKNISFHWKGKLQPTWLSETYDVAIKYKRGEFPQTRVMAPELKKRNGEDIPHMYDQECLCLFRPGKNEWDSTMRISHTILPWASLWLFYYEIWHATGEWLGGGEHPGNN